MATTEEDPRSARRARQRRRRRAGRGRAADKSFVDDLDVDSLAMVQILVGCEEKFGVTIPDEESKNLKTVGDAVAYVEAHS